MARAVLFLTLCLAASHVSGFHITVEMNKTIQDLLQYYKIDDDQRYDGNSVFSKNTPHVNIEAKLVFMGRVLETYEEMFGRMLKKLPEDPTASPDSQTADTSSDVQVRADRDVRAKLSYILEKVQNLRKKHFQEEEKILRHLRDLRNIKMDDWVTQSKALWELPWLYEEASQLTDQAKSRQMQLRRRRQARRFRSRG